MPGKSPLKTISRSLRAPFNRSWAFKRLSEYHTHPRKLSEIVKWAMEFGGKGYYKIGTLQIEEEILRLAGEVQKLQPRVILEIGTARAGTLLIWSALASEKVITCDLNELGDVRSFYESLPPPGSKCKVSLLSGDSHSAEFRKRVEKELGGVQADFLFIDGDHTVDGVRRDFEDYRHLVRPGGLIAFHDIVERQVLETNQVYQFWKTIRDKLDIMEFVADPDQAGYGIGVVRVPAAGFPAQ